MSLPSLELSPDSSGYTIPTFGETNIATELDGGAPRIRADKQGAVSTIAVQWSCSKHNYDYLMAFYRTAINNGADPFELDLILDTATPDTYVAQFVPGTLQLSSQEGLTYVVQAQLYVLHDPPDGTTDAATITAGPE
jgi:hypothetical protein